MKRFLVVLTAASVVALLAALTAGSASATVLCKSSEKGCSEANRYAGGTKIKASLKSGTTVKLATLYGVTLDICQTSTLTGEVTDAGGSHGRAVKADVSAASFGECSRMTTPEGFPWHSEINQTEGGAGTQSFSNFTFKVNTIFGSCTYGGLNFAVKGGSQAELVSQGTVKWVSGNAACPKEAIFTATYVVSEPSPLYVGLAAPGAVVFCESEPQSKVCPQTQIYPPGTELKASTTFSQFTTTSHTIKMMCGGNQFNMVSTDDGDATLKADNTAFSFSGCTYPIATLDPGTSQISVNGTNGNGTITHTNELEVKSGLYGGCKYLIHGPGELVGGSAAEIVYDDASMVKLAGWCPELLFSAIYSVKSPGPLYLGEE
jgi:hypothetical protein